MKNGNKVNAKRKKAASKVKQLLQLNIDNKFVIC